MRQYIPQYVPEKRIEYVQVPVKQVRYEYIPVERYYLNYLDKLSIILINHSKLKGNKQFIQAMSEQLDMLLVDNKLHMLQEQLNM